MSGESQVTGSSINASYPIPGQNNSSQGLRDNFAAIKAALNRAGIELTQLRQNVVLKNPIDGLSAVSNDYYYGKIFRPQLHSYTETFFDLGQQSGTTYIDFNRGNFQKLTVYGDVGPVFKNVPSGNQSASIKLWFSVQNPGITCYLPDNAIYGTKASYINSGKLVFPRRGDYLLVFDSVENGKKFFVYSLAGGLIDYRNISSITSNTTTGSGSLGSTEQFDLSNVPIASPSEFGVVKVDGTTIGIYDGVITVIGGIPVVVSDQALKTNVSTITSALDKNRELRGVDFTYIREQQDSMGVIAQELEKTFPQLVTIGGDGFKRVNYSALSGLFIECIKDLESQVCELRNQIIALQNQKS